VKKVVEMVFGGMVATQAAYDDVACEHEIGFMPFIFENEDYD